MRRPPNSVIAHQGIEDRKQLPHVHHQSYLLGLVCLKQPLVELLDGGVVAGDEKCSHVERCHHRSSPTTHLPLLLQPADVCSDALGDRLRSHLKVVVFSRKHLQELAPSGENVLQLLDLLVGKDAGLGRHTRGESSEDPYVYPVGLGEASGGLCVVASLSRIDHGHRDADCCDGSGGESLVVIRGFQNDQFGPSLLQEAPEEFVYTLRVIGDEEDLLFGNRADIKASLGDVDADVSCGVGGSTHVVCPPSCCGSGLADTGLPASLAAALVPVRAPPMEDGRDDPCFSAIFIGETRTKEESVCRARIGRTLDDQNQDKRRSRK